MYNTQWTLLDFVVGDPHRLDHVYRDIVYIVYLFAVLVKSHTAQLLCEAGENVASLLVHGPRGVTVHPPPPPPRIIHEWYHFVQAINNQDVNALSVGPPPPFWALSKWPPSKSPENWIAHIFVFGQPRNTNLVSKPTFSWSLNPIGMQ